MPFGQIFLIFLRLGLTSFGGPVAHIGYFREAFVHRRRWVDDATFADLVALCQFLPGPASSQVGLALGLMRGGYAGALAAWLGFTGPSALALILFAYGLDRFGLDTGAGWVQGLKLVAVAVVAQAVWSMGKQLCPDRTRVGLMLVGAVLMVVWTSTVSQLLALTIGGVVGWAVLRATGSRLSGDVAPQIGRAVSLWALGLFLAALLLLPLAEDLFPSEILQVVSAFYRTGSLVFGGGHVILPLLQAEVVPTGWVSQDTFLAGYGAAQAVPGPLFTFAGFLGTVMTPQPSGWLGGLVCVLAIFAPSFLLVPGALPHWDRLRRHSAAQGAMKGVNASVVGLLLAALYDPLFTSTVKSPTDFALALIAFVAISAWRAPPWALVLVAAVGGAWLG